MATKKTSRPAAKKSRPARSDPRRDFPIVGIGASAGGIEALQAFFSALPEDLPYAIVCVMHLSPEQKSGMPRLFGKALPKVRFEEISASAVLRPGGVYFNPPGRSVSIINNRFRLSAPARERPDLPIDHFFLSLALDRGGRAIGIALSGAGTDGVRGLLEIKAAGGMVMAQDPSTAEFNGMPSSAVATDEMDCVVPPADMPGIIGRYFGHAGDAALDKKDLCPALNEEEQKALFGILSDKTGHRFEHNKKSVVARRVFRRMGLAGASTVAGYLSLLGKDPGEVQQLTNDLMIGVTRFFRDPESWERLKTEVVQGLLREEPPNRPLRVWVPGCSTGEEAYSAAMIFLRQMETVGKTRPLSIFATDINEKALQRAREGSYPESAAADIPAEYRGRYFSRPKNGASLLVNKEVREAVVFAKQNLLLDPPFSRLDLIICRNLFIYLEQEVQEKAVTLFHYALRPDGFLFLGNAESVGRQYDLFKSLGNKKHRIYKRIGSDRRHGVVFSPLHPLPRQEAFPALDGAGNDETRAAAQRALLEHYAPPAAVINRDYEIVYYNGPTGDFLAQPGGAPTQNLLDLAGRQLRTRLRRLLARVVRDRAPGSLRAALPEGAKEARPVIVKVVPLVNTPDDKELFSVSFEAPPQGAAALPETAEPAAEAEGSLVRQLEAELQHTKDDLQATIEQFKSMNEELHSANEELQAANEELETSREELQSLNEELVTVNAQLQDKVEEQENTNDDLNNFIASSDVPTLFLDRELRIKRFTPAMTRLVKFIPTDIGRPFAELEHENLGPDLSLDAQKVLHSLSPVSREEQVGDRQYIRRTLPYRTQEDRIDGVVITFVDITSRKKNEERLAFQSRLLFFVQDAVIGLDAGFVINYWNESAKALYGWTAEEAIGRKSFELLKTEYVGATMEEVVARIKSAGHGTYEAVHCTKDDRKVSVDVRSTILLDPQGKLVEFISSCRDITERKKAEEVLAFQSRLLSKVHDAVFSSDRNFTITYWNQAAEKMFGWTKEEALGKNSGELLKPLVEGSSRDRERSKLRSDGHWEGEARYIRKDGTYFSADVNSTTLIDADGKDIGNVIAARDITERKKAEQALRESEERFKAIAANTPDHILVQDRELRYLFIVNPQLGLTEKDMIGKTDDDILSKDEADNLTKIKRRVIETGTPVHLESSLVDRKGNRQFFEGSYVPKRDTQGRVDGLIGYFRNVTARKKAEMALRETKDYLDKLIHYANAPIIVWDPEMRITRFNGGFEKLTGHLENEILGQDLSLLFPEESSDASLKMIERALKGEQWEWVEIPILCKDGRIKLALWNSANIYAEDGATLLATIAQGTDITERKMAEEALREAKENLEVRVRERTAEIDNYREHLEELVKQRTEELTKSNADLEQFAYAVSHDLQEPLRAVAGFLGIIKRNLKGSLDAKTTEHINFSLDGAKRMQRLIDDLLDYSRVNTRGAEPKQVDAKDALNEAMLRLGAAITESGAKISAGDLPVVYFDKAQLSQLFQNIIGNAIKFRGEQATVITISADRLDDGFRFAVADNGIGIDPQYAEKIFMIFQRLHTRDKYPGTGIGLAVCKRIVERHNGRIWVESTPGSGSTFYFTIPDKGENR